MDTHHQDEEEFRKVLVRVSDEQWRAVRFVAAANDIQPSQIVRDALREYFARHNFDLGRIQAVSDEYAVPEGAATGAENSDRVRSDRTRNSKSRRTKSK